MPDLRPPLFVPGEMEAHRRSGITMQLKGLPMLSTCFWSWYRSHCYQSVLALDKIISMHAETMGPGFLRAGRHLSCLFFCKLDSQDDTWTWKPCCPGFLFRRDSWPQTTVLNLVFQTWQYNRHYPFLFKKYQFLIT
jgi:hypothetical protein